MNSPSKARAVKILKRTFCEHFSLVLSAASQCCALGLDLSLSVNFLVQVKVSPWLRLSYLKESYSRDVLGL